MKNAEEQLRETARCLLSEKKADLVIGFEQGSIPGMTRPCVVRLPEETKRLVWNPYCSTNLAVYLKDFLKKKPSGPGKEPPPLPKTAIVVKGCDALSVALLVREKQVPREKLITIGMPCKGLVDSKTGETLPSCLSCIHPVAENADIIIKGESRKPADNPFEDVEAFENKSLPERWDYFKREMSKCIRCYACREVCPNCYCEECFADKTDPQWIAPGNELSDTMIYHLGRMFHQAGRCVGCGACVRACPVGVDLKTFTAKLVKDAQDIFDFEIGFDAEQLPLLSDFNDSDSDAFITDPEKENTDE